MAFIDLPKRHFHDAKKKLVAVRLPNKLHGILLKVASDRGWNLTDVVVTALDQYAAEKKKKGIKK